MVFEERRLGALVRIRDRTRRDRLHMLRHVILVAGLLFGSGMCALIYQMVWLREFRFVFGASTLASAAVLSVFLGGLGAGGFWFGRRVDRNPRPLALYAYLELLIAASAALTPLLVWIAREFYVALGGVLSLGTGRGHAGAARANCVCAGRSDLSHGGNAARCGQSCRGR